MLDGWSWMAVELPFDGLQIEDCVARLKGRLDRIDSHPQLGLICWDYKTGRIPGKTEVMDENDQPQLKAYLLALSKGNVAVAPKADDGCGAGYIELRSPADMKHQIMFDPAEQHGAFLKDWEKRSQRLAELHLCRKYLAPLDQRRPALRRKVRIQRYLRVSLKA